MIGTHREVSTKAGPLSAALFNSLLVPLVHESGE